MFWVPVLASSSFFGSLYCFSILCRLHLSDPCPSVPVPVPDIIMLIINIIMLRIWWHMVSCTQLETRAVAKNRTEKRGTACIENRVPLCLSREAIGTLSLLVLCYWSRPGVCRSLWFRMVLLLLVLLAQLDGWMDAALDVASRSDRRVRKWK